MSRRPRLVEEGTPIALSNGDNIISDDTEYQSQLDFLEEEYRKAISNCETTRTEEQWNYSSPVTKTTSATTPTPIGSSSLQVAAASATTSSSSLRRKRSNKTSETMHFEIGGGGWQQTETTTPTRMTLPPSQVNQNDSRYETNQFTAAIEQHKNQSHNQYISNNGNYYNGCSEMETEDDYDHPSSSLFKRPVVINSFSKQQQQQPVRNNNYNGISTYFVVGGTNDETQQEVQCSYSQEDRMEIEDILPKPPLLVIDGANVAYAYAKAARGLQNKDNAVSYNYRGGNDTLAEPDVQGIQIVTSYFINAGCRIQVVLPVHWLRKKPRQTNHKYNGTISSKQIKVLQKLEEQNILCCSPPADDDDAYAIAIARREDVRAKQRNEYYKSSKQFLNSLASVGRGAFILSNDFFRDAIARDDVSGDLSDWLNGNTTTNDGTPPGRISYSFCDLGSINDYGDPLLDFMPNPRHLLIDRIEKLSNSRTSSA